MEEKKTFFERAKTFVRDHAEGLISTGYVGMIVLILREFYKGILLANEKTRLEIASLQNK